MSIRVTKVDYNGDCVKIEYEQTNTHTLGIDSYKMEASYEPNVSFKQALANLREHVASICEFDSPYAESINPRGVSVSWNRGDNEIVSATVFAIRRVTKTHSPFNIHTPTVQFQKRMEEFPSLALYLEAIKLLLTQAREYLGGARAQIELPFDGDAADDKKK